MLIGYARVSTIDQTTALQMDALRGVGVHEVFSEKGSSVGARPQLQRALARCAAGDTLVVWKLDRIARSLPDLLSILGKLKLRNVSLRSLTEPIDTSSPIGDFIVQVLGAVAQLERAMIRERVVAGQVSALVRGVKFGRPRMLTEEQISQVLSRRVAGEAKQRIAASFGVSRTVVDRIVAQSENPNHRRYGPQRYVIGPLAEAAAASRSGVDMVEG